MLCETSLYTLVYWITGGYATRESGPTYVFTLEARIGDCIFSNVLSCSYRPDSEGWGTLLAMKGAPTANLDEEYPHGNPYNGYAFQPVLHYPGRPVMGREVQRCSTRLRSQWCSCFVSYR